MLRRIVAFICVFAYYASPYRLVGIELPELLFLSIVLTQLFFLSKSTKIYLPIEYRCFMIYMWFIPPVMSHIVGHPCSMMDSMTPIALILYSLYLAILLPNVNVFQVLKYYKILVYVAVCFFLIQEICVNTIGFRPTFYLSFLDSYYDGGTMTDFAASRSEMSRSSSFFLEPSHFVQYIIPYVCIVTCEAMKYKKITKELCLVLLVVLWSKSGVGYLELLVSFVFLFLAFWKQPIITKILLAGVFVAAGAFVSIYFSSNPFVANILERTNEFSMSVEAHGAQSGFIRIWRGYFIFLAGETLNIIFGTANAAIEYVSLQVYIPGVRYEGGYLNGIQSLLVGGGIVGTVFFFAYIRRIYKSFTMTGKCIIVAMICCFFLENMLFTPKMFLYILIAYSISKSENNK